MEEQLVSLDTAKLAKEKGFEVLVGEAFYKQEDGTYTEGLSNYDEPWYNEIKRPTQSLLQKWLREIHKLKIYVLPNAGPLINMRDGVIFVGELAHDSYEEALEVGLKEALKLINNDKNITC